MQKYKLTKETKEYYGITLYRIEALKDFRNVSKGDKGGWIEKEDNLSQEGNAWVYGDARVYGNAWVYGDAWVYSEVKAITGYWFAHKHEDWNITEVDMGDGWKTLVRDYKEPEEELEEEMVEIEGKKYSKKTLAEAMKKYVND